MKHNVMQSELYRIWKNKRVLYTALFFLMISIIDLYLGWSDSFLNPIHRGDNAINFDWVSHPAFASFLSGRSEGHIGQMLIAWLLPIYLLFVIGDSYIKEKKLGYSSFRQCRVSRKRMLKADLIVSFLIPFIIILIFLAINFLLAFIVFHGGTNFNDLQTYIGTNGLSAIDTLQLLHPYTTYFIYMIMFAVVAGLYSMVCKSITWIVPQYAFVYPFSYFVWMLFVITPYNLGPFVQPFTGELDIKRAVITAILYLSICSIVIGYGYIKRTRYDEL